MSKNIQCPSCHKYKGYKKQFFERGEYFRQDYGCMACGHQWHYCEDEEGGYYIQRGKYIDRITDKDSVK